jgi:uncharacterized protein (DUF1330 family)
LSLVTERAPDAPRPFTIWRIIMNANLRVVMVLLSGAAVGAAAVTSLMAQGKAPFYAVIDISEMIDTDAYVKAVSAAEPRATTSAGGQFIVRSSKPTTLDGIAPNRFVVIKFDTEEKAKAWYNSPAIKEVNAVRMKTATSRAFLVEGLSE